MPILTAQEAQAIRYSIYSVGIIAAALLIAFLYLYNFTSFFRAGPLL
jgi:hypothetical protein